MIPLSLNKYYSKIDELQFSVLKNISDIYSLHESLSENESFDTAKDRLCRDSTTKILLISNLLEVTDKILEQESLENLKNGNLVETQELYKEKMAHLRRRLKEAQLLAYQHEGGLVHKQRIDVYVKSQQDKVEGTKEDLFSGRSTNLSSEGEERSVDQQILSKNKNISKSLKLTKQLMTMSVMQTELNIETLDQQSKDVGSLNDKLVDLESILNKSKQIVRFIERQDKKDKRRIYMSIAFLLLCSLWVVWNRILKLPFKILLWTMMRFFGVLGWFTKMNSSTDHINVSVYASVDPASKSNQILESFSTSGFSTSSFSTASTEGLAPDSSFESWLQTLHDEL